MREARKEGKKEGRKEREGLMKAKFGLTPKRGKEGSKERRMVGSKEEGNKERIKGKIKGRQE